MAETSIQAKLLKLRHCFIMLPGINSSCTSVLLARVINIAISRLLLDTRVLGSQLTLAIMMVLVVVGAASTKLNVTVRASPLRTAVRVDVAPRKRDRHQSTLMIMHVSTWVVLEAQNYQRLSKETSLVFVLLYLHPFGGVR